MLNTPHGSNPARNNLSFFYPDNYAYFATMAITIISSPSSSGVYLSGNLPKLTLTADMDVRIRVYIGSHIDSVLLDETYTPDFNNTISLDITEVIKNALSVTLPSGVLYVQGDLVKEFRIQLGVAGDAIIRTFKAILCGLKGAGSADGAEFLSKNFLTWQPQQKKVTAMQPEWLTYYATNTCYLFVSAEFDDNTVGVQNLNMFPSGKAYTVDTSVSRITALFGRTPVRYNVFVAAGNDAFSSQRISNVQQYIVEPPAYNEQFFFFQNSLGGIDTVRCIGEAKHAPEYTPSTALMNEVEDVYNIEKKDLHTQNTGWLGKAAAAWLHDFFVSKQHYKHEDDVLQAVVIDEVTAESSTAEDLISFEFTYRPAIASEYMKLTREFGEKTCTWSGYVNAWGTVFSESWNRNTWFTSDTDVAYLLAITDTLISLTKTYNLLDAFSGPSGSFIAVSVEAWQKMPVLSRNSRISAFKTYVNNFELINVDTAQTNNVFRASGIVSGDAIEKWLLVTGSWNDEGVWDDRGRMLSQ
jgi:hypothetical protein